jgi:hypothetical protein
MMNVHIIDPSLCNMLNILLTTLGNWTSIVNSGGATQTRQGLGPAILNQALPWALPVSATQPEPKKVNGSQLLFIHMEILLL